MMKWERECVQPFVEGRSAWRDGCLGQLTRWSRLVFLGFVTFGTATGAPWWVRFVIGTRTVSISLQAVVIVAFSSLSFLSLAGLLYLRKRSMRSLEVKGFLHDFAHHLRDHHSSLHRGESGDDGEHPIESGTLVSIREFADQTCEYVRTYFELLTGDRTVACAMRLAVTSDIGSESSGTIVYRTIGRSRGFNPNRALVSEDIPADSGIPCYFAKQRGSTGILLYTDIKAAAEKGAYTLTKADIRYPEDVVSFLVAPINAWSAGDVRMIGLLYVTSRSRSTFSRKHTDSMRFAADLVAPAISCTVKSFLQHYESNRLRRPR